METWLNNLQVDDKVVVEGVGPDRLTTVKKFTKLYIFTTSGEKFCKDNGCAPGQWSTGILREATEERVNAIKQNSLSRILRNYDWSGLSLEALLKIDALVKSVE